MGEFADSAKNLSPKAQKLLEYIQTNFPAKKFTISELEGSLLKAKLDGNITGVFGELLSGYIKMSGTRENPTNPNKKIATFKLTE